MKKSLATIILLSFLAIGGFGFLFALGMNHHEHSHNCPFMPGEKTPCVMNIFDHTKAWKGLFTSILPALSLLAALLAVSLKAFEFIKELDPPISTLSFSPQLLRLRISVDRSEYQSAFSQGILHPKNP